MCFNRSLVHNLHQWNWDGDVILHECVVPSSRPVVGHPDIPGYPIDVREFLVTERNEVMRHTLSAEIPRFIRTLPGGSLKLFRSRDPGSFDHRAGVVAAFVAGRIAYAAGDGGGRDPWQFPDETLCAKEGDCEDRALLLASLLLASGISSFNVRVALGRVRLHRRAGGKAVEHDHVWVVYKTEAGGWRVLEPLEAAEVRGDTSHLASAPPETAAVEYVPQFLFNDVHLWQVHGTGARRRPDEPLKLCERWSALHPTFVGTVHKQILTDALSDPASRCPPGVLRQFQGRFLLGLDPVDTSIGSYDPRDHCDTAYIEDDPVSGIEGGWTRATRRLRKFHDGGSSPGSLDAFFHAAHAIADFYAHSSFMEFAKTGADGRPQLYDPAADCMRPPDYTAGPYNIASGKFKLNKKLFKGTPAQAAAEWAGKLISGRYAIDGDSWPGLFDPERVTFIPGVLTADPTFSRRGALPHHNQVAVDDEKKRGDHVAYADDAAYGRQYCLRYDAAKRHITQAFAANWNP